MDDLYGVRMTWMDDLDDLDDLNGVRMTWMDDLDDVWITWMTCG